MYKDIKSLPSRERGLKHQYYVKGTGTSTSLPSRERGLKREVEVAEQLWYLSLPSRERGLKHHGHGVTTTIQHRRSLRGSVD